MLGDLDKKHPSHTVFRVPTNAELDEGTPAQARGNKNPVKVPNTGDNQTPTERSTTYAQDEGTPTH